jgi:putative heme-binding domain-containing protein
VDEIGRQLVQTKDPQVQSKALEIVRLRNLSSLGSQIRQVADNAGNPAELRIEALGALLKEQPDFSDKHFFYLYEQLKTENKAPLRQQAASVLGQGKLSDNQLLKLATDYLPKADAFILPRLVPVFQGAHNEKIGKALAATLINSPSLDSFSEENLQDLFAGYTAEVKPEADQLITKSREARAGRLERIKAMENRITNGDLERGRMLFFGKAICWTCHKVGAEGGKLGPDLTSIQKDRSAHDLLEAIVYPGASFVREYETYRIKTSSNTYTGVIQEQTPDRLYWEPLHRHQCVLPEMKLLQWKFSIIL